MKRRYLAPLLAGLVLWALPALASSVAYIPGTGGGNNPITTLTFGGGTTLSVTPTVNVPSGSLLIVIPQADNTGTNTFSNCHDSTANAWTADALGTNNGAATQIWHSYTTNLLTTAGSISCTNSIAGLTTISLAFSGTSATPFDSASPAGASNSGSSQTVGPSGTLACPGGGAGCEVCVAAVNWHVTGTMTLDATWTSVVGAGAGSEWAISYKIVSAATALSYTASTTASANSAGSMACFQAAAAGGGAAVYHGQVLIGAGR